MKSLHNGCSRSEISVTPTNWNTAKASIKKKWRIHYRFYDPAFKNNPELWGKQILLRGMNKFKDLAQRQAATRILLEKENDLLDNRGYNPVTNTYCYNIEQIEEINPTTSFIEALWKAHAMLKGVHDMLIDIKSAIKGIALAAGKLYDTSHQKPYSALKISQVSRKHLIYIFKQCAKDNTRFSANRQNKYRAYLLMLFKELLKVEAVDSNPVTDIPIEKAGTRKLRQVLTGTERMIIDTNLRAWDYTFWRYMRIFFRSGSRTTEMLSLKNDGSVNLEAQEFRITVKKGKSYMEQIRPIPDDILPLWVEVMEQCRPGQYLFSRGFLPGQSKIRRDNVSDRWKKYVKDDPVEGDPVGHGLGIKKDFYSLKHLNTDKIDEQLDIEHAAATDGHTTIATTQKHYAVNHLKRKIERLKKTSVDFI